MTMPLNNLISLHDCNTEFGRSRTGPVSLQDGDVRTLAGVLGGGNSLWDLYGKSNAPAVVVYGYDVAGTYTIPGHPQVSSARIQIRGGAGGGGGGGMGGDGDSSGAAAGGGGGGAGGNYQVGIVRFPLGATLTIVVGAGGFGGAKAGPDWIIRDGTWNRGGPGRQGGTGEWTLIYANGELLTAVRGGGGGYGGGGGDRLSTFQSFGGGGGFGEIPGTAGGPSLQGYSQFGGSNTYYVVPGWGGQGAMVNEVEKGGRGGDGGPGTGSPINGSDGDDIPSMHWGTDGAYGGAGSAGIYFGETGGAVEIPPYPPLRATLTDTEYDGDGADIPDPAENPVGNYTSQWNVISSDGVTFGSLTARNLRADWYASGGTASLTCTIQDSTGRIATSNVGNYVFFYVYQCVAIESFLPDGTRAGDIEVGSIMELGDDQTLEWSTGEVSYSQRAMVQGVRIVTLSGASLRCSTTAPIPTQNGYVAAPDLLGHSVPVMRPGISSNDRSWEEVVSVEDIGLIEVQHITVGDKCFWAGEQADAFILHHNQKPDEYIP